MMHRSLSHTLPSANEVLRKPVRSVTLSEPTDEVTL